MPNLSHHGRLLIGLALVAITGCGGISSEPPRKVEEAAITAMEQAAKTQIHSGNAPRIEPSTPGVTATSPKIRPRDEFTVDETAADALARIGPAAVPQVLAMLQHSDPQLRARAAKILSRIGPESKPAVPLLIALLNDGDEDVRKSAAHALGQIGPAAAEAVPALVRAAGETR